jgi:hypothetical protein
MNTNQEELAALLQRRWEEAQVKDNLLSWTSFAELCSAALGLVEASKQHETIEMMRAVALRRATARIERRISTHELEPA